MKICSLFVGLYLAFAGTAIPLAAQKIEHPLDPLTFQEYWTVLEVLRDAGHVNSAYTIWFAPKIGPSCPSSGTHSS